MQPYLSTAITVHSIEGFAKYATIALLAVAAMLFVYFYFKKRDRLSLFLKYAAIAFASYLLLLSAVLFVADLAYHYSEEYANENWLDLSALTKYVLLPVSALAVGVIVVILVRGYTQAKNPPKSKVFDACAAILLIVLLVAALVGIAFYYELKIKADGYYNSDTASVKNFALYASSIFLALALFAFLKTDKATLSFDSKSLARAGVCISMSFALSYIKLWDMPNGGALTLASLFPLALYSYLYGVKKGLFAGFCYALLQAIQDPWIIHPAQFLLDYPLAFTSVGLAGIFRDREIFKGNRRLEIASGCALVGFFRYVAHVLSGTFAFEAYAEGQNAFLFSLGYNAYVIADIALVIAVVAFVFSSKTATRELVKSK